LLKPGEVNRAAVRFQVLTQLPCKPVAAAAVLIAFSVLLLDHRLCRLKAGKQRRAVIEQGLL
jgi:hypothetical protein